MAIPDPDRRLFDFLIPNSNPSPPMKILDILLYLLCIVGALAGYFLLTPPLSWR